METGLVPSPLATSTNTVARLNNVAGYDYEVTYTNSDTLAKNEWISVYVSKSGKSLVPYWLHKKTLLFRYDPAASICAPSIEALNGHTVRISIPEVSSVFLKRTELDGLAIEYEIGKVDYP